MHSSQLYSGSVPANYDTYLVPLLFEPYAADLTYRIGKAPVNAVLEIACGTGIVSSHVIRLLESGGSLTASDINADMLHYAQSAVKDNRIKWDVADAQSLPYNDQVFDTIYCQFGVMFFADKVKAYKEIYRVLKPGGRFLFNVWGSYAYNQRSAVVEKVMSQLFGASYPNLLEKGPYSYYNKEVIQDQMTLAGFPFIEINEVHKETRFTDVQQLVKGFVDGSPLSAFLNLQPKEKVVEVKEYLTQALLIQSEELGNRVPMQALVIETMK
jgi:ubiquinone/menaquinone biosynthesis C-methylase UbiE